MTRRLLLWAAAGFLAVASACGGAVHKTTDRARIRVAAAADLNVALPELVARFSATHAADVSVSFGSSGTLYAQLLNQAPFDMFFSADVEYPRQLAARGLTLERSEFTYAIGRLVLWVPAASAVDVEHQGLRSLVAPTVTRVSVANPEHGPYGRAAVAALKSAGVYDRVQPKLVVGENVAQAMQFAQSGTADAGLVARSLALAPALAGKGRWFEVPADAFPRMVQGGTILKWAADADAARALRDYVLSPDGRAILKQFGVSAPEP